MAKTDIGPRISVEGESEYRKQMSSIIQQQKEYSSELNLVTANLGKNATAQQKATSIASVLKKQIQNQESALSAQNTMLQKAVTKWGDASTQASAFRTAVNKTSTELATLKSRLSDAENGLGEFASETKSSGESLTASVTAGTLAAKAYEAVGSALLSAGKQVIQAGVSYNAQLEQYQTALTNMLGSSQAAEQALENIKQDAAKTPFDTAGLVKANELLISTGVDADSSRKVILALGDAVSATGGGNEELSRMAQNLQQIRNAGQATSEDIKQFAYAGIDVYGLLADYTGKSTAEVQKMTVTYDVLTAALEKAADEGGRYYGSMSTQSETLNGQWSTLTDNATQLAGLMTGDLTDGVKTVVGNLNDLTVAAAEAYKTDGLVGLATEIASLNPLISGVINEMSSLGDHLASIGKNAISILDQWSYKLNKALGKDAYAKYDSYEDYRSDTNSQRNSDSRHQAAHAGKGISTTEKQYDRLHPTVTKPTGGNSGGGTRSQRSGTTTSGTTPEKAAADQKKLAKSVTDTNTELLEGTGNIVGAIKQVTETADNTYNVYDGTTKQLKGTTKETAQTVTRTWTEMVDGIQKNYKQVVTLLDGVEQSSKTTVENVATAGKTSTSSKAEKIYGVDGVIGALDRTTQTTKQIEQVIDQTTGEVKENVVSTTDVVTDSYTAMVDGVAQTVERTTTYVNGIVTDVQEKTTGLKTEIKGIQGTVGSFSQFILDLDTKLGGLEKAASNLSKSPLGTWFSDLKKGYRASDSFFEDIDIGSMAVNALVSGASGYVSSGGNWVSALVSAGLSIAGDLIGTNLSGLANESNGWGQDLATNMANGVKTAGSKLAAAAKNLAGKVASFLHFSRPDEGPLREYEQWMPDMVKGMAQGIKSNAYRLRDAVRGMTGQLDTQMTYDVGRASPAFTAASTFRRISMGGINVNIYPHEGQDAEEIAQYTINRLEMMINSEASANGEVPVF